MFRFRVKPELVVFSAAIIAVGAGCSGNRSMLPGVGPQTVAAWRSSHAGGQVTRLSSQPPTGMQLEWLLTDGSILAQSGSNWSNFYRYYPDANGSYADGTWKQVASLQSGYGPDAAASQVLGNGKFVISGGEYNTPGNGYDLQLTNLGAVYDPVANTFTPLGHPRHWGWIGDSPSTVAPDGRMIVGQKLTEDDAALDPTTLKWKTLRHKGKADFNAEEGWTLLPDGTIMTADVKAATNSEIYNPTTETWKTAGSTIVDLHSPSPYGCLMYGKGLCYYPPGEIGPAILRPDGTVFFTGSYSSGYGPGHTAIYNWKKGTWTAGPDFPNGDNAGDNFGVLEPSGNVLIFGSSGTAYEWNGTTFSQLNGITEQGPPLLLPTGQIMVLGYSSVILYTPTGSPKAKWAPTIKTYPSSVSAGQTYKITGTKFTGWGQAEAFGDEYQNSTSYPLVRITNNASGKVWYAHTHDHSTMGIATGRKTVSTMFDVPSGIASGASTLVVVANGI
ncbi:MAG: hypothetical protein JO104_10395, partial [Candidatus Eremiobacteraeota bacterium]|nr:hypothetical protein [Candidatus Eremiobacteraeota bacterium]